MWCFWHEGFGDRWKVPIKNGSNTYSSTTYSSAKYFAVFELKKRKNDVQIKNASGYTVPRSGK